MVRKAIYLLYILVLMASSGVAVSQTGRPSFRLWKLHSLSGEARLNGLYREQQRKGLDINEYQKSSYLSGGVLLRASSSVMHPNFLMLDIDAGYMPETRKDNFIVVPDQSEVRTLKKLGVSGTFFQHKKITLNLFGNYDESYATRENLTDIKSVNKHWGGTLGYVNKVLPVSFDFHRRKWEEQEIRTGRKYQQDQLAFGARMSKSFTKHDRNEFRYSHDENVNLNQNLFRVANINDNIDFVSHVNLDAKQRYNLNTMVSNFNQQGYSNLKRFQAGETVTLQLPKSLFFSGNYNFFNIRQNLTGQVQHSLNTTLGHQLFQSLQTRIHLDYNAVKHTVYHEFNVKTGFEFTYTKKIPGGQLLLAYSFDRYHQNYDSDPVALIISNEQYLLSDNKIVLLRLPAVNTSSVIIRDITGTIIYEEGLDYILLERGKFLEIRRIPGGSIANNAPVLVDYSAIQPGSYRYDANMHVLTSNIYLFKNILSFNYRFSTQDYSNLDRTDFVALNYFTQNLIGCRLDFGFFNAGAEYEDYKSSILPYHMLRYYVNFQKNIGKRLITALNGNIQDYVMLDEPEPKYQKFMDVTGKVTYSIFKQTHLNLDLMYRKQTGRGIDLNLLTAKAEIASSINRLYVSVGVELYRRNYIGEKINFKGTYVKLVRKF